MGHRASSGRTALSLRDHQSTKFRKATREKGCWPHLWVLCLSQGGPRGHYHYPTNRVPPCRSSKKGKTCAHTQPRAPRHRTSHPSSEELGCCHASRGASSHLPTQGASGATTCPVALAPAFRLRYHHASRGASSHLPAQCSSGAATRPVVLAPTSRLRVAQVPPHVPWRQLPPAGSGATACPTALCRPRAIKVYEYSPVELLS
jgi:hypothetical protein